MPNAVGFPFKRGINFLGTYRAGASPAARLILEDMLFEAPAAGAYTLTVNPAAVTLTGQPVSLRAGRALTANPGAVAVAGSLVTLRRGYRVTINPGAVATTGQSVGLRVARKLGVTPATVPIAGQSVALRTGKRLAVNPASVPIQGPSVTLRITRRLSVLPATVGIVGQTVGLSRTNLLTVLPGSVAVTGQPVSLRHAARLSVEPGTVSVSGQAVTLTYGTGTPSEETERRGLAYLWNITPEADASKRATPKARKIDGPKPQSAVPLDHRSSEEQPTALVSSPFDTPAMASLRDILSKGLPPEIDTDEDDAEALLLLLA